MSKFIDDIKKIYEKKKDLPNPPSYIKTIKELLELERVENDNQE